MTQSKRVGHIVVATVTVALVVALSGPFANAAPKRGAEPRRGAPAANASANAPTTLPPNTPVPGTVTPPPKTGPVVAPPTTPGDPLRVELLTFGPGDHPFTVFGHNALRVRNERTGRDDVYNFGTFNFDSPLLALEFLKGRMRYWLSRSTYAMTVAAYQRENRTITAQVLDLGAAEKAELAARLEKNALPENREYAYDYFRDNCSTRVRDSLDAVLGGRVRAATSQPGRLTLRGHALRMASANLPLYLGLLIVLGPSTDRPMSEWDEGFLPEMLQLSMRKVKVTDAEAARSVVASEELISPAHRSPPHREPPMWLVGFILAGVGLGLFLLMLGRGGARYPGVRLLFGLLVALLGAVLGFVGCFLAAAWAFTPHVVVYRNENVLLFAPFAILLALFGIGTALGRPGAIRKTYFIAACALGVAIAAGILKAFSWAQQDNIALIGLLTPVWLGMVFGSRAVANALP